MHVNVMFHASGYYHKSAGGQMIRGAVHIIIGDELILEQITNQLSKLVDVLDIKVLEPEKSVNRELLLVKVAATVEERQNVISIANVFRANIVDIGQKSLVIELTGTRNKLEAFISLLEGYEILELARTGLTGLSRGADDVRFLK